VLGVVILISLAVEGGSIDTQYLAVPVSLRMVFASLIAFSQKHSVLGYGMQLF
jgi:hypothetical protein